MSAAKLRQAATEIRMDWADPQAHRNPAAASFYLAAADLLDAVATDREADPYLPKVFDAPAITLADAYLGSFR